MRQESISMPRFANDLDTAGGDIIATGANVFINGEQAARDGDAVASHGHDEHDNAVLIAGPQNVFVNGIRAVKEDDLATCDHPVICHDQNVFIN